MSHISRERFLVDKINDRKGRVRYTPIVRVLGLDLGATFPAIILIIMYTGITGADSGFYTPTLIQYPLMSQRKSATVQITIITMVLQIREYAKGSFNPGDLLLSAQRMHANKRTVEFLASPITHFRHDKPMLQFLTVIELERIISRRDIQCNLFA